MIAVLVRNVGVIWRTLNKQPEGVWNLVREPAPPFPSACDVGKAVAAFDTRADGKACEGLEA